MTTATAMRRSLMTCTAAGEHFALDVATAERVLRFTPPSKVPHAAAWMAGVISVGKGLAKMVVQGIVRHAEKFYILLAAEQLVTSQERLAMRAAVEDSSLGR